MKSLIVVPCYKRFDNDLIFECVASIRKFNPNLEILVVDSDSEDKTYFGEIKKYGGIEVLDAKNKNYDTGAYWIAYKWRKDVDYFYLIHDSLIVGSELSAYQVNEFNSLRYFFSIAKIGGFFLLQNRLAALRFALNKFNFGKKRPFDIYGFDSIEQLEWTKESLERISMFLPMNFISIFGPIMFISRRLLSMLEAMGVDSILPQNKMQQMAMERIWGICLSRIGVNITCSIQGDNFKNDLNGLGFKKKLMRRN